MNSGGPTVSVLVITYQHVRFIEEAVRSALTQDTTFDFEVVVGDDASTDGTTEVLERLAKHDSRVRLHRNARNLGVTANLMNTYARCGGSYVAVLEGDDYWTDPTKLQRQVEQMERHPDVSGSFHDVVHVDDQSCLLGTSHRFRSDTGDNRLHLPQLLRGNEVATCSVMVRRLGTELPGFIRQLRIGDWPVHLSNVAEHGPYLHVEGQMAAYRIHRGGTWTGAPFLSQQVMTVQSLRVTINACSIRDVAMPILRQRQRQMLRAAPRGLRSVLASDLGGIFLNEAARALHVSILAAAGSRLKQALRTRRGYGRLR